MSGSALPPAAGAVLTGGASRRMGADKALVPVHGRPMVLHVVDALRGAGADPVVAVGGDEQALRALGLDWVADRYPGEGPLGGVLTALTALTALTGLMPATDLDGPQLVVVVATDLPALTPAAVISLLEAVGDHDAAVATSDRIEPLCAVWRPRCWPVLQAAFDEGERAVHVALAALDHALVPLPAGALRNVNERDDLAG